MENLKDKAIAKITEEALKINNAFSIFIEEHLTNICTTNEVAQKLLVEDKNLADFCKKCEAEARERAKAQGGGFQINGLPDAEYFEMAEEYYNITPEDKKQRSQNVVDFSDFI